MSAESSSPPCLLGAPHLLVLSARGTRCGAGDGIRVGHVQAKRLTLYDVSRALLLLVCRTKPSVVLHLAQSPGYPFFTFSECTLATRAEMQEH